MALRYKIKVMKKYKDRDGNEKTTYVDIGAIMDGKNGGLVGRLESVPIGWDGWFVLGEPEQRQQRAPTPKPAPQVAGGGDGFDDDIPF